MIIKHKITGEIIFDGDKSRLAGANLSDANLSDADLRKANLYGADLRNVYLRKADLRKADLTGADLTGADLTGVCFWGCAGNRKEVKSIFVSGVYPITYTSEVLQIGCENHAINDWWQFDDERIIKMDGEWALKFWRENKEFIKLTIERFPATPTN